VVADADAVEFRVIPWIVWKYRIHHYGYWAVNHWHTINVFVDPLNFQSKRGDRVNGDGTFFYPGQDGRFPEESRELAGPLSSIRAKNFRRGAQDYEYLWLAKEAGLESEIETIVDSCVPAGLWEAKSQEGVSWSNRGYNFEQYRKQLAELLESRTRRRK
jgi:hypothetical protein